MIDEYRRHFVILTVVLTQIATDIDFSNEKKCIYTIYSVTNRRTDILKNNPKGINLIRKCINVLTMFFLQTY